MMPLCSAAAPTDPGSDFFSLQYIDVQIKRETAAIRAMLVIPPDINSLFEQASTVNTHLGMIIWYLDVKKRIQQKAIDRARLQQFILTSNAQIRAQEEQSSPQLPIPDQSVKRPHRQKHADGTGETDKK
jgi:hypothetical protein